MKIRYKFLREGFKSNSGDCTWKIGEWKHEDEVNLCKKGFHCSKEIWEAFSYVQGEILAEVEVKGNNEKQNDKETYSDMCIIKAWKWQKKDSVALAIYSSDLCIGEFEKAYPDDKRPREAIEAAKKWLLEPTEENESAAVSAARSAAAAAWSAWSAAWSAAASAAAAVSAAASAAAAESAWSAAASAEKKVFTKIYSWFDEHLKELQKIK